MVELFKGLKLRFHKHESDINSIQIGFEMERLVQVIFMAVCFHKPDVEKNSHPTENKNDAIFKGEIASLNRVQIVSVSASCLRNCSLPLLLPRVFPINYLCWVFAHVMKTIPRLFIQIQM